MMVPATEVVRGKPNPKHWTFPDRLRRARRAAGLTASALSQAAGLARNAVARLEAADPASGRGRPTLPTVERLARALGRSAAWLAYGHGEAVSPSVDTEALLLCQDLAVRAKEARSTLGLSMRDTAQQAGVTDGAVRSVEAGRQPATDTLEALAKALGVSPGWLAFGEGQREPPRRGIRAAADVAAAR